MLKIGIVGFGFMGRMHYRCWQGREDAQIVAICDANENIVEDSKKAGGNIAGAEEAFDFSNINIYTDLKTMLAQEQLDAISLTLPTYLHAENTCLALEAGVHVLCEKPMSLDISGCDKMIETAQSSGKKLQIGHCVRFWPEYAVTKEIIDSGKYGRVLAASLRRLSCLPTWCYENWILNEQRSGGVILDLHIHDTDYVQYLLGLPRAVNTFGVKTTEGMLAHSVTQYLYDKDILVTGEGGWVMAPSFGFEMSFNIVMEKATITYDCTRDPAFRVCPMDADAFSPEVPTGDGYTREIDYFADSILGQKQPTVLTLQQSRDSVRMIAAEIESLRSGKPVSL